MKVTCWPVWGDDGDGEGGGRGLVRGRGAGAGREAEGVHEHRRSGDRAAVADPHPRLPPEVVVVRVTRSCFQEVVSVVLGELTSATTVPPAARSRSLSWTVLPTDAVVAAFTETVAV